MLLKKVGIDIVHGCQLRCIGCPNSTLKPKIRYCDPADFKRMLNNIDAKVGIFRLYNFGEPMLHPKLDEIVKIIGESKLNPKEVEITTNGQYWNGKIFEEALRQKIITHLYVSCDGDGTMENYQYLRQFASWQTFLSFLKEMKKLRDKVCPQMKLGTRTITENKYKKIWGKILKSFGYKPLFRQWSTRTDVENAPWKQKKVPHGMCKFIRNNDSLYVDYDGSVVPCCIHPKAYIYGNLLSDKASGILNGENYYRFKKNLKINRKTVEICKECTKS